MQSMKKFGPVFLIVALLSFGCQTESPRPAPSASATPRASPTAEARASLKAELLREFEHGGFYDQYLMFSPDGRYLASWLPEGLTVFEVATGKALGKMAKEHRPLAFSTDGSAFYTVTDKKLWRWKCPELKNPEAVKDPKEQSADGAWRMVKTSSGNGMLVGQRGRLFNWPAYASDYPVSPYNQAHVPDGTVVAYSAGPKLGVIRPGAKEEEWTSEVVGRSLTSVAVSDDGSMAVAGGMSGALALFDLTKPEVKASAGIPGEIRCLALDGDGRTLAIGCGDGMTGAALLDLTSEDGLTRLETEHSNVWSVALTGDGKLLAVGADDGKIRVFQISRD